MNRENGKKEEKHELKTCIKVENVKKSEWANDACKIHA
jgi:hypothetical protein